MAESGKPIPPSRAALALTHGVLAGLGWTAGMLLSVDSIVGLRADWALLVVIAIGAALGAWGLGRVVRGAAGLALGLFLLVTFLPWPGRLALGSIRADSLPSGPVDGIVVLSASVTTDGDLSMHGADRLMSGLDLYRRGVAPRLIVSRILSPDHELTSDSGQRRIMATLGLAPEVYVLDTVGTTRLEAVRAAALALPRGWRRIVVVTSPTHTRRACATFEKVGFTVTCRPSTDRVTAVHTQRGGEDRRRAFGEWVYETLGWIEYRLRGWA